MPPLPRALGWLTATTTRTALVVSVAAHVVVGGAIGARSVARPALPAPVDERAELLFLIAESSPEIEPSTEPAPEPPPAPRPRPAAEAPRAARRAAPAATRPVAAATDASPAVNGGSTPAGATNAPSEPADAPPPHAEPAASAGPGSAPASNSAPAAPPVENGPGSAGAGVDLAEYGRAVHARIVANVQFPDRAAREGIEGTVLVELLLDGDGRLVRASIVGDAHAVLRDAALDAVRRSAPFPAPPRRGTTGTVQIAFQIPLRFFLKR